MKKILRIAGTFSVGGIPVTPKIEPRMIACGASAIGPHGQDAKPATA